jgi:RNA polymerase sigma factor (sigma-70 family)
MRPRLRKILCQYRIPAEDAEDLLQETLLIAVTKWAEIRNQKAWLAATLKNRCLMYWRSHRSRHNAEPIDPILLDEVMEPREPPQLQIHASRQLQALLEVLPIGQRKVLLMRCGLEMSPPEVAARLGYHPASIRKVVQRSLARLRRAASAQNDMRASRRLQTRSK